MAGAGSGSGSGSATMEGFVRRVSTGACSASTFFGFRDGTIVVVKWSGKLYDSLGIKDMSDTSKVFSRNHFP
jgi:hypothetical protein